MLLLATQSVGHKILWGLEQSRKAWGWGGSITPGVILSSWNGETLPMGVDSSGLLFFDLFIQHKLSQEFH